MASEAERKAAAAKVDEDLEKMSQGIGTETATAVAEPPAIPAQQPAAGDTSLAPAGEQPPGQIETVTKAEYDTTVSRLSQLLTELERMRQAYNTLKGKFDAEVPRLQARIKEVETGVKRDDPYANLVDEFGEDVAARFKAQDEEIKALKEQIQKTEQPAAQTAASTTDTASQEAMNPLDSQLVMLYPRWLEINWHAALNIPVNPGWAPILDKPSGVQSLTNRQLFMIHVESGNLAGAADICRSFESQAAKKPTGEIKGADQLVEPVTSGGGTPPLQGKPILKLADYKKDNEGKSRIEWHDADKTGPGDVLKFTIAYTNIGSSEARGAVIDDPVPAGTTYIGNSAEGKDTVITFSIDGKNYEAPPMIKYKAKQADGKKVEYHATPDMYKHIRWRLTKAVPSRASGTVSFKVTVK